MQYIGIGPERGKIVDSENAYEYAKAHLDEIPQADKLAISKPYAHNLMLRRYGQPEIIDGRMVYAVLPDSDGGTRIADEAETYHIKPTSEVKSGTGGMRFRTYIMLRGSSTYNTEEMSKLIDGLVSECKEQGIETLPPEELERMMQAYEQNRRK